MVVQGLVIIIVIGLISAAAIQLYVEDKQNQQPLNEGEIVARGKEQKEFDKKVQAEIANNLKQDDKKHVYKNITIINNEEEKEELKIDDITV